MRDIPSAVVREALWWLGAPPSQTHPRLSPSGSGRSPEFAAWLGEPLARRPRTVQRRRTAKASIGDACRFALYAWSGSWTEAEFAEAVAELTRRVDALRVKKTRTRKRISAQDQRNLNARLRNHRQSDPDILASVDRYLTRHPVPETPAWQAEIRARVNAEPVRRCRSVYRDGAWWSDEAAWQKAVDARAEAVAAAARPALIIRPTAAPASRRIRGVSKGVTMGELARVAAEVNGRRI